MKKILYDILLAIIIVLAAIGLIAICIQFFPDAEAAEITPLIIAQSQIGLGEIGGNNRGVYVHKYLGGKEGLPWCAGFVSYCIKKAGYNLPYLLRAKDYIKIGRSLAPAEVHPGDLVVFVRASGGHVGIIEKVNKDGFISIEGNTGSFPAKVKRIKHTFFEEKIYRFVRIGKQDGRE